MTFKILKDFRGSPDGSTVVDYVAGTVVELTPSLAAVAVKEKWAREVSAKDRLDSADRGKSVVGQKLLHPAE